MVKQRYSAPSEEQEDFASYTELRYMDQRTLCYQSLAVSMANKQSEAIHNDQNH
ncbi:hypothetical protein CTI12_AA543720 [Artemisia annua]|uniref:Uncharacterized protein n=1 Tax=Artemisia annua TaxID=35608 RepID=A0A2U1L0K0_ARTAN|nr:hypothetical protein CTI12_AA543720 [Artemisia annua]